MKINCPNCNQEYDVPAEYIGHKVECEKCGNKFIVEIKNNYEKAKLNNSTNNLNNTVKLDIPQKTDTKIEFDETKTCPFCAEKIKFDAIKCRYCGEYLDGRIENKEIPAKVQLEGEKSHVVIEQTGKQYKAGCLIFGLLLAIGVIIIVKSMQNLESPAIGAALSCIGFFGIIVMRMLIWWHHG